ncbi:MAG: XdhC family protein [Dysosmobacter sp.]
MIFGAGHIARALVPLLRSVEFRPVVYDDRPALADPAAFPDAERVVCGDFRNIAGTLPLSPEDYVVVMTSGHLHDLEIQEQILRQELAYVGVIGSRAKIAAVNARLREAGISEEKLCTVHTPVGTPIKAVTPAEIAVSIAGEMIYERALPPGGPGSSRLPPWSDHTISNTEKRVLMLVVIRGAGDLATGIALRLHRAGYQIVMTDLPAPHLHPPHRLFLRGHSLGRDEQWRIFPPGMPKPRRKP